MQPMDKGQGKERSFKNSGIVMDVTSLLVEFRFYTVNKPSGEIYLLFSSIKGRKICTKVGLHTNHHHHPKLLGHFKMA